MNLQNITPENKSTNLFFLGIFAFTILQLPSYASAWEIDFSHHQVGQTPAPTPGASAVTPASRTGEDAGSVAPQVEHVDTALDAMPIPSTSDVIPLQPIVTASTNSEIVILNTAEGFVPRSIALHAGQTYTLHVINVNEKQKNVSFVMDSFNQFQSTYFNEVKTFSVTPTTEGNYTYQCPETNVEGRAIVLGNTPAARAVTALPQSPEPTAEVKAPWPASAPDLKAEVNPKSTVPSEVRQPAMTEPAHPHAQQVPSVKTVGEVDE